MSPASYIIGISGGSGSGKTSFVHALRKQLDSEQVCFISLDDYYLPREDQFTDDQGIKNFDLPESIKAEELIADLNKLIAGDKVTKKKYNFNNELATDEPIELHPAKVIVVEGLYIYHYPELKTKFDLKLYVDAQHELKIIRRIKRDQIERNYPLDDVIYRYEHHVMPSYRKHIGVYKEEVDLIINNNKSFDKGLAVVLAFITGKLNA